MEGPPLGPGGEDITWPDQVAPRGRKASSTRKSKPQTSNLKPVPRGVEGVPRPVLRDLDGDVVQVACSVGVVGDERGDVLRHPPEDRQDDVLHHFRWREGVKAPVVHRRQA